MKKALALLTLFCVAIYAQEPAPEAAASEPVAAEPISAEAVPEPTPEPVAAEPAPAAPPADSVAIPAEVVEQMARDAAVSRGAAESDSTVKVYDPKPVEAIVVPKDDPEPEPQVAEPEPEPAVEPEPEPEIAESNRIAEESMETALKLNTPVTYNYFARAGVGISDFRNHKVLRVDDFRYGLKFSPALSVSLGFGTKAYEFSETVAIMPELQWSLYRANEEMVVKPGGGELASVYEVGVYMHAIELPVLMHFNFGSAYAELGPQFGANLYAKINKNADYYRPDLKCFAFGIAAGGGVNVDKLMLGARLYMGVTEYSKDVKGAPWSFQLSLSQFVF